MAAGVPFVSSRIKPTVEITQNGKGGLLFKPEDPNDLSKKINILLSDTGLYGEKVNEGKNLAKQFDWAIIAKQTEEVYHRATLNVSGHI